MRIICFLALCALSSAAAGASTGTVWNELNTVKEAGTLRSLAQAPDGTLISVGDAGLYRTSTDGGVTWVTKTSINLDNSDQPLTKAIFDLKVSGPRLIMAGANRLLLTSDDSGATWTTQTPANINAAGVRFNKVSVTDAGLTAVGTSGAIIESDDNGDTWTRTTAPAAEYRAVAGDGTSTAVAVGYQDSMGIIVTRAETTTDTTTTVTWTKATTPIALDTRTLFGVAYNGSTYAAVGANGTILTSTDGTTWTDHSLKPPSPLPNFTDVIAVGNGFLTSANNGVAGFLTSTDSGATWTPITVLPSGSSF
ncbi:MAG: hypothetical protein JWO82_125, partial [Akkermansiaceae bacterium]|nr:hypothetical protein [Akkermansiaceae bacterium]